MGIEQERSGGGERLWRRADLRRLRVAGLGSSRVHRPERASDGDMETDDCLCRKESWLVLSHWSSP